MGKFCDIQTRNELADFLKIPRPKLTYVLYVAGIKKYYRKFEIPKKTGGTRVICAPFGDLKTIQTILANALYRYDESIQNENSGYFKISHAFEKGKSIITNAQVHRNKRFVLNLDLENFYDSFHFGRVQGYFEKNRNFHLPHEVAVTIAQIACYDGHLPQGAPTSPIITNLIFQILDMRLLKIAKKYKLDYTRYADDLTFSTNNRNFLNKQSEFLEVLSDEIIKAGFSINHKKTRLQCRDSKQEVTGLIVNKKVNVDRAYYKKTKAMAHHLYTHGNFEIDGHPGTLGQLEGRFSFIDQLDRYNNKHDGKTHTYHTLNGRERRYQAFIFYKYFFSNDKPLIVTEGKTDVLYLKAALQSLYQEYPLLVEKDGKNYKFNITFFKRSKRWNYFFNISPDGADTMKNLYYYFVPGKNTPNYFSDFCKLCCRNPQNPVILLYDNETVSTRPLKNFLKEVGLKDPQKEQLKQNLSIQLIPQSNLYLLTTPLSPGQTECEIEDLFDESTLSHEIGGRSFMRTDKFDKKIYYGKDEFSKYVFSHYAEIDFSGFKPLLDKLNAIVTDFSQSESSSQILTKV